MKQDALDLGHAPHRRQPVTEALKRDVISALQIETLPDHLGDKNGKISLSLWPEARDFEFLEVVLNDMHQPAGVHFFTLTRAVMDLVYEGRVIEGQHFYGSAQPGEPGYQGWKPIFWLPDTEIVSE